jgi:hypothetical protein
MSKKCVTPSYEKEDGILLVIMLSTFGQSAHKLQPTSSYIHGRAVK